MANLPDRNIVHKWAGAAAATAAVLPVGADAAALFAEEVAMVIRIASLFGHSIDEKTATQALTTGALGGIVGGAIFEAANIGYPFTIPIKITVATGVMELLANATYDIYAKGGGL